MCCNFSVVYTWLLSIPAGQVTEKKEAQPPHLLAGDCLWREWSEKENGMEPYLALYAHEYRQSSTLSLVLTLTNFNCFLSLQTNLSDIPVYFTSGLFTTLHLISKRKRRLTTWKFKFASPYRLEEATL